MIQSQPMSSTFCAKAIKCDNYIQNYMPHKALQHMTLEEAWTHVKPDVSTFSIFGSEAWAFILDAQRKTMERKSRPLIFVGYCEDVKAYRLFDSDSREVLFWRNVQFDEHYPSMDPPSPTSSSLLNIASTPLHG